MWLGGKKDCEQLKVASGLISERILSPPTDHDNSQMRQKLDQIILETAECRAAHWAIIPLQEIAVMFQLKENVFSDRVQLHDVSIGSLYEVSDRRK